MRARQTGSTLIEVLIAMLITGVGLLGLAGLQAISLRSNHSSNLRSQATLLAYDMTDRMRANRAGYEAGDYNNPTENDHSCAWDGSAPSSCTAAQMAEHDVWEWNNAIAANLPDGVGVVCLDGTPNDGGDADNSGTVDSTEYACGNPGDLYAVKLWWVDEIVADASGDPVAVIKGFATGFQP